MDSIIVEEVAFHFLGGAGGGHAGRGPIFGFSDFKSLVMSVLYNCFGISSGGLKKKSDLKGTSAMEFNNGQYCNKCATK